MKREAKGKKRRADSPRSRLPQADAPPESSLPAEETAREETVSPIQELVSPVEEAAAAASGAALELLRGPEEVAPPAEPAGSPASPPEAERPMAPAIEPAPDHAGEALEALRERMFELLPEWAGRPEDPASVLLELCSELYGELRGEIERIEDATVPRLIDRLGLQPLPPRPARGVVILRPEPAAFNGREGEAVVVPAGTEIVAFRQRSGPAPRVTFETEHPARVGPARLARALAVDGVKVRDLPVDEGAYPLGSRPAVAPFGERLRSGGELYLGDPDLLLLREKRGEVAIEWPGCPRELCSAWWEYRAEGGWRRLPISWERVEGERPRLRMALRGPLPDLTSEVREYAELPWIRCLLDGPAQLEAPVLSRPAGGAGKPPAPRAAARLFLAGEHGSLDFSFEPTVASPPSDPELEPALYLGWDGPAASSVYFLVAGPEDTPPLRAAAGFAWECSSGGGWEEFRPEEVADRTGGLSWNGTVTVEAPSSWEARQLFGEKLWWTRARWRSGERGSPVSVRAVIPWACEVVQGSTMENVFLSRSDEIRDGVLVLPALAQGEIEAFDELEIRGPSGSAQRWRRCEDLRGSGPEDRVFILSRRSDGRWCVSFGDGEHGRLPPAGQEEVRAPRLRIGIGAAGNLPPGALGAAAVELPGIAQIQNPLATHGGADKEPLSALRKRAAAEWRTGGRAVSPADFELLVRPLAPDLSRVHALPDTRSPPGILVVLVPDIPRRPGRFPPAVLRAVESHLAGRVPMGMPVHVTEPAYLSVDVEIETGGARPGSDLEEKVRAALEAYFDPAAGGPSGRGFIPGEAWGRLTWADVVEPLLDPGMHLIALRPAAGPGRPAGLAGPVGSAGSRLAEPGDCPPELVLQVAQVRLSPLPK